MIRSLRASAAYRADKVIFLASDTFSLNQTNYKEDWFSLRLEYVHDNTPPVMTNIMYGMRYKVWVEMHKQFAVNLDDGLDVSLNDGYLGVLGFDVRHYQKIHRQFIWANRLAGGVSFGNQKLIYYLGGVDSWLFPQFNNTTEINQEQNYAFQTQATPVRDMNRTYATATLMLYSIQSCGCPYLLICSRNQLKQSFCATCNLLDSLMQVLPGKVSLHLNRIIHTIPSLSDKHRSA